MSKRLKWVFLLLVLTQGLHSIEEYLGRLWEVFPPATFLTGLVSENLVLGFLVINIGLFVVGLLCWAIPIRKEHGSALTILWFWIILELVNGLGHLIWSLLQKMYTPGLITAPFLLILAASLIQTIKKNKDHV